jgi:predicted dehydrogenase
MVVCHAIDYVGFITGLRATRVYGEYLNAASPGDIEDVFSISSRWGERAVGNVVGSSIMRGIEVAEERIWGTKGTLVMHSDGLSLYSTRPVDGKRPGRVHQYRKFPTVSWTAEWARRFVDAVREGRDPEISSREGWENLAFITGAYRSMTEGGPIDLPAYVEEGLLCRS